MTIKLGLPSKGRLQKSCIDWFAARGVAIERAAVDREYAGRVTGVDGVDLVLLSASEIPRELAAGRIDLGVTGEDLVRETIHGWKSKIELVSALGFGAADLIIAVPVAWVDVENLHDFDAAAAAFRQAHGFRLRIATKYHNLARNWLTQHGVADYQLVDSQGATEATPLNLTAEAIIDITSSGETLRANHLKVLEGEPILKSEAMLCRSVASTNDSSVDSLLSELLDGDSSAAQ
ncbi:MAG: ATP phosphoribosyltransferase [Pikeienuella sp.]